MPLPDGKQARLMVVAAHPCDAFDNTGGTCAEHIAQGDHVTVVICTSGIYTHNERLSDELRKPETERDPQIMAEPPEAYAAQKRAEAEGSLGCFGITDVVVLPYDDHQLTINPDMMKDLEALISDRRPHIIMQQDPVDGGALYDDHALIGVATCKAIQAAATARYADSRKPWCPVEVYFLGVRGINSSPSGIYNKYERVDVFIDVTKHVEAKVRAHQLLASQGQDRSWGQKRVEAIEGHAGIFAGVPYAEAYVRMQSPVCDTLPICANRYANLQMPSADSFGKKCQLLGAFVPEADGSYAGGFKPAVKE